MKFNIEKFEHHETYVQPLAKQLPISQLRMSLVASPTISHGATRGLVIARAHWPRPLLPCLSSICQHRAFSMSDTENWKQEPHVVKISPLSANEAKWSELQKIEWADQTGKTRVWEAANRKTRGSAGVDAIAIAPILLHPKRPAQTLIIKQFRPPLDAFCIEFPAGLVDASETIEQAALRELKEETGYSGTLVKITPVMGNDPGLTTANMQFAIVECQLQEGDPTPEQHLDPGEFIQRFVVPLDELYEKLMDFSRQKGVMIDARLFHFAAGMQFMKESGKKYGLGLRI